MLSVTGKKSFEFFEKEGGSHRWQRTPPTEKRDRIQTSTITVAVLTEQPNIDVKINPSDIERWTTKGTGNGGQKINKTECVVCLKHIPTGIIVKCQEGRDQRKNEERAWEILKSKLQAISDKNANAAEVKTRNSQIGSGERSDKRRTYREKDDLVVDHITGKSARLKDIFKGKINLLH